MQREVKIVHTKSQTCYTRQFLGQQRQRIALWKGVVICIHLPKTSSIFLVTKEWPKIWNDPLWLQPLKLEFKLDLWASKSHVLFNQGNYLLVLANDLDRGWNVRGKWALKVTCPARKSTCPRRHNRTFFEPCKCQVLTESLEVHSLNLLVSASSYPFH